MTGKAREFIDFWIQNSVHAAEQYGAAGGEQNARVLVDRCLKMAESQGLSQADIEAEVGDLAEYIKSKSQRANQTEKARGDRSKT